MVEKGKKSMVRLSHKHRSLVHTTVSDLSERSDTSQGLFGALGEILGATFRKNCNAAQIYSDLNTAFAVRCYTDIDEKRWPEVQTWLLRRYGINATTMRF